MRFAFFHTELSRKGPGLLLRDILSGKDAQVEAVAAVVRVAGPDVLVLAGVDWDLEGHALGALADRIGGYPYRFAARPNRGIDSGYDLDGDGRMGLAGDAVGHAEFSGQEGLAVISRLPFDLNGWRDFSGFPWQALQGGDPPEDTPETLPLSTTAHWDLPVVLPCGGRLSLLIWHATPPVFDGPEDRNGRRNRDETAFWLAYLDGRLGFEPPEDFVLAGAANADPVDGEARRDALVHLLNDPRITDPVPRSWGGAPYAPDGQRGDPTLDTVDWPEPPRGPGNLRVDYVLPSAGLTVQGAGVLWPAPGASLGGDVETASRHRLVWVDIDLPQSGGDGGQGVGVAVPGQ